MATSIEQNRQQGRQSEVWQLRSFGQGDQDLNINFYQPSRPQLITDILGACSQTDVSPTDWEQALWALPVSKRLQALVKLVFSSGLEILEFKLHCQKEQCHDPFEISFTGEELISGFANYKQDSLQVKLGEQVVNIVRPTGQHQLQWLKRDYFDETSAELEMISSLIVSNDQDSTVDSKDIDKINQALDEFDPMVNFTVSVKCPKCGQQDAHYIDLEQEMLKILGRLQRQQLRDIHELAKAYHWKEEDIMTLPKWRRQIYLRMIESEKVTE